MGKALSIKDTIKGEGPTPATPKTAAEEAKTAGARAYRDNQTGAIYTNPAECVNGCTLLVGEEAEEAIRTGKAPARASSNPPTPEEQTAAEIARREKAEADAKEAADKAAADKADLEKRTAQIAADNAKAAGTEDPKAAKQVQDKQRKNRPATKRG